MTDERRGWADLAASAPVRHDKETVKAALPLEWVLGRAGVALEPDQTGRLVGLCPFHQDSNPSFAVFGEQMDVAGCWTCGFRQGDVFDVIMRLSGVRFAEALSVASRLLDEFRALPPGSWRPMAGAVAPRPKADPADLTAQAFSAWETAGQDATALRRLIHEKQQTCPGWAPVTPEFLRARWYVGASDDWTVVVPHLHLEADGQPPRVYGLKTRTARSHLYAKAGSDLSALYGEWRDHGLDKVALCEGESDAWCADAVLDPMTWDVLSLPSGAHAQPKPEWVDRLSNRDVVLCFDGDSAGRSATRRWYRALAGRARSVRVAALPDGEDLASTRDLMFAIDGAVGVVPDVGGVRAVNGVYAREGANGVVTPLCNWSLQPEREIRFEDGSVAYEGLLDGRDRVTIDGRDLRSDAAAKSWSERHGRNFLGTGRDAQAILGLLEAEGPFLGRGLGTRVAGWHEGNFVWPGGSIGSEYWVYRPPVADVRLDDLIRIQPGSWDPRALFCMLALHTPAVTSPLLAWLALSPLRALCRTFPILALTGSSGSGKTTLVEAVLDALGWKVDSNLTATTPHAVHSLIASTNGVPVWFDEYRPGAREDALVTLNQTLRDAYNSKKSMKGGYGDSKQELGIMTASAPVLITGEDAFVETSHVERMILVNLPIRGRNPAALAALRAMETSGLSHAYISWLVRSHAEGTLPSLDAPAENRVSTNLAQLGIGWALLRQFLGETTGAELPAPDWSLAEESIRDAARHDPVAAAVHWAMYQEFYGGIRVAWRDQSAGGCVYVRTENLVREVNRAGQFILPGGYKAVENDLRARFGAEIVSHPLHGRVLRVPPVAADALLSL